VCLWLPQQLLLQLQWEPHPAAAVLQMLQCDQHDQHAAFAGLQTAVPDAAGQLAARG
jgi:hypothetical protein